MGRAAPERPQVTRTAPPWAMRLTAGLRRPDASLGWSWVRLAAVAAAVAAVYLWARTIDPRPWVPVVLAAAPAAIGAPIFLLAISRIIPSRHRPR